MTAPLVLQQPARRAYLVLSEAGAESYGQRQLAFLGSKSLATKVVDADALAAHIRVDPQVPALLWLFCCWEPDTTPMQPACQDLPIWYRFCDRLRCLP